jgi:hypothetical protein
VEMEKNIETMTLEELENILLDTKEEIIEFEGNKFYISDVTLEEINNIKDTEYAQYATLLAVKKINGKEVRFEDLVKVAKKMNVVKLSKLIELINKTIEKFSNEIDAIKKK